MARVFVSYRRIKPDQDVARAIRDRLVELEHQVFFDTSDLHAGENWKDRLRDELAQSDHFVPIVSSSYLESSAILEHELEPAVRRVDDGTLKVVPVNLAYDGMLPENVRDALSELQYAKWRQRSDTPLVVAEIEKQIPPALSLVRGARAFDEVDSKVFASLGRQDAIDEIVAMIRSRERPHILLHGVSGSGKTSFLRAGVHASVPEMTIVELSEGTADELRRAYGDGDALVALDQFEQVLLELSRDDARRRELAAELERLTREGARFLFCIREEFRTAFEKLLPDAARDCTSFGLLPFEPHEAVDVLGKLLDNGRVAYDPAVLPPLCEALAEGVPRTVLPAILQILVQYCRARKIQVTSATRDDLLQKDSLFERHVDEAVIARLPRSVPELDGTSALIALTSDEVKSRLKTIDEIASEQEIQRGRVERTLDVASGRARVVTVDFPPDSGPPRYRLAHDLFVRPVQRIHARAARRRKRRNIAAGALLALVLIAGVGLLVRAMQSAQTSLTARREADLAASESEQGTAEAAALHAAEAFNRASARDPLRGTYALTALHASLAVTPPIILSQPNDLRPEVTESGHIVSWGTDGRETVAYRAPGPPLRLGSLVPNERFAISRDGRWVAALTREPSGTRWRIFRPGSDEAVTWEEPPRVARWIRFNGDASLVLAHEGEVVRVWSRETGKLLQVIPVPGLVPPKFDLNFDKEMRRAAAISGAAAVVTDVGTGSSHRLVHESEILSARLSGDGRRLATLTRDGEAMTLRLWDVSPARIIAWHSFAAVQEFRIDDVSTDGTRVLGAGDDERLYHWNVTTHRLGAAELDGFDFHTVDGPRLRFVNGDRVFVSIAGGLIRPAAAHLGGRIDPFVIRSWIADGPLRQWGPVIRFPSGARPEVAGDALFAVLPDRGVVQWDLRQAIPVVGELPSAEDVRGARLTSDMRYAIVYLANETRVADMKRRAFLDSANRPDVLMKLLHDRYVLYVWTDGASRAQLRDLQEGKLIPPQALPLNSPAIDAALSPSADELRLLVRSSGDTRPRLRRIAWPGGKHGEDLAVLNGLFTDDSGDSIVSINPTGDERLVFALEETSSPDTSVELSMSARSREADVLMGLLRDSRVTIEDTDRVVLTTRTGASFRVRRRENGVVITDAATDTPVRFPRSANTAFRNAIFSRDGRRVVLEAQGSVRTVQVWDLITGNPVTPQIDNPRGIATSIWIDDDKAVAILGGDGVLRRYFIGDESLYVRRGWQVGKGRAGAWLSDLAQYTTGMRLDQGGTVALTQAQHDAVRERLRVALRAAAPDDINARYALERLGWK